MKGMYDVQPPVQLEKVFPGLHHLWVVDQQLQKMWEPQVDQNGVTNIPMCESPELRFLQISRITPFMCVTQANGHI